LKGAIAGNGAGEESRGRAAIELVSKSVGKAVGGV